jgi:SAM-dependent methyltransferase
VIGGDEFCNQAHPRYDLVVLQNCIIEEGLNLVQEMIRVEHDSLLTLLVPGYLLKKPYFPFVCALEKHVLNEYYSKAFQEQVESKRVITGRRTEIFFYEVFGWKKKAGDPQAEAKIHAILDEACKGVNFGQSNQDSQGNTYETQEMLEVYLNFHYGPNSLGVDNFPAACAQLCIDKAIAHNLPPGRVLDVGCSVGRSSIDLAEHFSEVVGVDFSSAFVKAAQEALADNYELVSHKVKFVEGDACSLSPSLGKFSLVFGGNLIDRLPDPAAFLNSIGDFIEAKGMLVLTSPYSWLEVYTPQEKWVGGYLEDGKPVTTSEGLARILVKKGFEELCAKEDIRFSIKDNDWVYQYTLAEATFWVKQ